MFRYFGSKVATKKYIKDIVQGITPTGSVADAFGGLGTIGAELKSCGYEVTTCDVLTFPHYFQLARIGYNSQPKFTKLKKYLGFSKNLEIKSYLNKRATPNSWLVREYSEERMFFTNKNAIRIAGTWNTIQKWNNKELLNPKERAFLIASFLNSMDAVANTAGTYYAYLKTFDRKALRDYSFDWINIDKGDYLGNALHGDALENLSGKSFDILYLDPPYNNRNYSSYYHLPESLAKLKKPKIKSDTKSGMTLNNEADSQHIRNGMKIEYLDELVNSVNWETLIVHYADGALIPLKKMRKMLKQYGLLSEKKIPALGYTTKSIARNINHNVFTIRNA